MEELLKRIKEEIENDPHGIGYAGKSDDEIMSLLNNPQIVTKMVDEVRQAPISRILSGLAEAPNIVKSKDITDAKKAGV